VNAEDIPKEKDKNGNDQERPVPINPAAAIFGLSNAKQKRLRRKVGEGRFILQ